MGVQSPFNMGLFGKTPTTPSRSAGGVAGGATATADQWSKYSRPYANVMGGQEGADFAKQLEAMLNANNAQFNSDYSYLQNQGLLQAQGYQMDMDALQAEMRNARGQGGIANANNQIALDALKRQGPLLDQLLGLDKNQLDRSLEGLILSLNQGRAGLDDRGEQIDYTKLRNTQDVNTSAQNAEYDMRSSATARGAISTEGTGRSYNLIQDQLAKSLGDIDKTYGWNKEELDRNRVKLEADAKGGYGEILDAHKRLDLTDAEKRAQLDDERRRLENAAKSIGLSTRETTSRIQSQLNKIGLEGQMSANDVLKGLEDLRNNKLTPLANTINMLSQYGIDFNQLAGSQ